MPLTPGARIGPYDVIAPIGAGGMGEVFRARDSRLKRDVALKVLPATATGDADRRARFEREAQVLAALNHPSIAQVFGVELDGDAQVIVMEFVEGPTLADRLAAGPLTAADALPLASQICDGLEAAHERGIVHRDLKPANIKVRPDGTIKILDFGLARVLAAPSNETANAPTALADTAKGMVLGTASYMSPEQARGLTVDKRTDIWAFGCILYEMLTGAQTFAGETTTDILAHIVTRDPDWSKLPASMPRRIDELLRRCLQKNAKDRLRDIADARFEIEQARKSLAGGASSALRAAGSPAAAEPARKGRSPLIWLGAGIVLGAGVLAALWWLRPSAVTPSAVVRAVVQLPPDTSIALSRGSAVAVSPDGKYVVFAGKSKGVTQLYLRALDKFESQPLPGTEDAQSPFFSPDGRWIGFFARTKLKKVAVDGGAPVAIADVPNARGEAWTANDTILLTPANNMPVSKVNAAGGGKIEAVTKLPAGELSHRWPRAMPDGVSFLYSIWNDIGWDPSRLAIGRLDGSAPKLLIESGAGYGTYIRDTGNRGFLVYARAEGLLAAPFDESKAAVTGQSVPVIDSVITNLSGGAHYDLSASGTLAYIPGTNNEQTRQLAWVTLDGKPAPPIGFRSLSINWRMGPDGTHIIHNNAAGLSDILIEDLVHGTTARLVSPPSNVDYNPALSPDGRWAVFSRGIPAGLLYRRLVDGPDVVEQLTSGARNQYAGGFSPDGKTLAFVDIDPVSASDIWTLDFPPQGAPIPAPKPFVKTSAFETNPVFSPNGHWIAYQTNQSGRFEVFVRSFPDGQQAAQVSLDGGLVPHWAPSGREIYYRSLNSKMMAVPISDGPLNVGTPRVLFDASTYETGYDTAPDGQRFLMMPIDPSVYSATQINVVFNFLTELRQRVR